MNIIAFVIMKTEVSYHIIAYKYMILPFTRHSPVSSFYAVKE